MRLLRSFVGRAGFRLAGCDRAVRSARTSSNSAAWLVSLLVPNQRMSRLSYRRYNA